MGEQEEVVVGRAAPAFRIDTMEGEPVSLADWRGRHVVLFFIREFTWVSCLGHAAQLGRMADQLRALGAGALIIGSGVRAIGRTAVRMLHSPWPVLYDEERSVYRAYGLEKRFGLYQRSGTFVVDAAGILRFAHATTNPAAALPRAEVVALLEALGSGGA